MVSLGARVEHPTFGEGIVIGDEGNTWEVFFRGGDQSISKSFEGLSVLAYGFEADAEPGIDMDIVEDALRNVLEEMNALQQPVHLGDRWEGGTLIMKPGKENNQSKEVPIETFFNKIIMMRDRLRVLEQQVNKNESLSQSDKLQLQQYITRCYGSMTTFNVLFHDKEDHFKGETKR